jgi:hypothetical protein
VRSLLSVCLPPSIRYRIHQVVHVIPIVIGLNMLLLHVELIHLHGRRKRLFRPGVIANAKEDVSRHVDPVPRGRRQFAFR